MLNSNGSFNGGQGYMPWGEARYGTLPTGYQYTGQYDEDYIELYWYNSRWYDPALGRFAQADSIIPEATQGIQAWDRYAYVNNNPLRFIDPTGHYLDDGCEWEGCSIDKVNDDLWELCYPPFFDPHAMDNSILQGSVTVNSPRFSPTESYDRDPLGRVIDVEYWRGRGGSIIAFGDIFGILGDYLSQYAPPDTSTIEGELFYSRYDNGDMSFKGLYIINNTSDPVIMTRIIFKYVVLSAKVMIPKKISTDILTPVLPGQTAPIDFADVSISGGYNGSQGIGLVIIPDTGTFPLIIDFIHP